MHIPSRGKCHVGHVFRMITHFLENFCYSELYFIWVLIPALKRQSKGANGAYSTISHGNFFQINQHTKLSRNHWWCVFLLIFFNSECRPLRGLLFLLYISLCVVRWLKAVVLRTSHTHTHTYKPCVISCQRSKFDLLRRRCGRIVFH